MTVLLLSISMKCLQKVFYIIFIIGVGESFGEIALVHRDSFRNATIIADDDADLMVIDQELFDRSLRVSDNNRRLCTEIRLELLL